MGCCESTAVSEQMVELDTKQVEKSVYSEMLTNLLFVYNYAHVPEFVDMLPDDLGAGVRSMVPTNRAGMRWKRFTIALGTLNDADRRAESIPKREALLRECLQLAPPPPPTYTKNI